MVGVIVWFMLVWLFGSLLVLVLGWSGDIVLGFGLLLFVDLVLSGVLVWGYAFGWLFYDSCAWLDYLFVV